MPRAGVLFCLVSAAGFGGMGIFGKLAYDEGATVGTLLAVRFILAAILIWTAVFAMGRWQNLRALPRGDAWLAFGLGAIGYSAQAAGFFAALTRLDASILILLIYTYPTIVTVAAILLGREVFSRRTAAALVLASSGLVLVVAGAASGALDPLGTTLGLASAAVYSTYILVSDGVAARIGALALTALVCTGAAIVLTLGAWVLGDLHLGRVTATGYLWLVSLSVVSTVAAIGLFFAGLRLVGPSAASILSTVEPVTTVVLAYVIFGESLGPAQLIGGALVISAVLVIRTAADARRHRLSAVEHGDALL